jgi:hypothetical protein
MVEQPLTFCPLKPDEALARFMQLHTAHVEERLKQRGIKRDNK